MRTFCVGLPGCIYGTPRSTMICSSIQSWCPPRTPNTPRIRIHHAQQADHPTTRHRIVPKRVSHALVFATRDGLPLDRHVSLRDVKLLCRKLGFEPPRPRQHSLRHSAVIHYLRKGGPAETAWAFHSGNDETVRQFVD